MLADEKCSAIEGGKIANLSRVFPITTEFIPMSLWIDREAWIQIFIR